MTSGRPRDGPGMTLGRTKCSLKGTYWGIFGDLRDLWGLDSQGQDFDDRQTDVQTCYRICFSKVSKLELVELVTMFFF